MIERKRQYGVHRSFFLENGDQRTEPELRYYFSEDGKVTCQGENCKYDANICPRCKYANRAEKNINGSTINNLTVLY